MSIRCIPEKIAIDATALLTFSGPVRVRVQWDIIEGGGVMNPLSDHTDTSGVAHAKYEPSGTIENVVIQVTYGVR